MAISKEELNNFDFSVLRLFIASNDAQESQKITNEFVDQINRRKTERSKLIIARSTTNSHLDSENTIYFEITPEMSSDYEIRNKRGRLSIIAKNKETLKWLGYNLISILGDFHFLENSDLPPSYLNFHTGHFDFHMKYREPHLLPNTDVKITEILHTHSVDKDWGIWGHNLEKVFIDDVPLNARALTPNGRNNNQLCFSSEDTYSAVESYIKNHYGEVEEKWFMIAPNDNKVVCTCASCKKNGNTNESATPAVSNLLNRLAKTFPKHHFFTIAYHTTTEAPKIKMEPNIGVFISTINFPKTVHIDRKNQSVQVFSRLVKQWNNNVNNIYIWDYISNFDDYLSPFPVLARFKNQQKYFHSLGVSGFFLNGSGYDYSPFDDIKTFVLSALMIKPSLSVQKLIKSYCNKFYPVTGSLISEYIIGLEQQNISSNNNINVYASFREVTASYLDQDRFLLFYEKLNQLRDKAKDQELKSIDKLLTALSYTRLQMFYHNGNLSNGFFNLVNGNLEVSNKVEPILNRLKEYPRFEHFEKYKEDGGYLYTYLSEWESLKSKPLIVNLIKKTHVREISSGQFLKESVLLSDNIPGFTSDFHQGWLISGESLNIECILKMYSKSSSTIEMKFLINERFRMLHPQKIELILNGKVMETFSEKDLIQSGNTMLLKKKLKVNNKQKLVVRIYKNSASSRALIACDEVLLY